jgi:S-DNA-T family DNA segregation ATPase FtsK/SpoIIIE
LLGAFTCILAGILLLLSICASIFQWTFINTGPGDLFVSAYGMFSFVIPVYLFCAAWLLADPVFKAGRIFVLSAAIVPFLTLALSFSFIRDFDLYREKTAFFSTLGRTGLSIVALTATVVECLGILILHSFLFSRNGILKTEKSGASAPLAEKPSGTVTTVKVPSEAPEKSPEPSPAVMSPPPVQVSHSPEDFKLPEWEPRFPTMEPLKSTIAFQELEKERLEEERKEPEDTVTKDTEAETDTSPVLVLNPSVFTPYSQASGPEESLYVSPPAADPEELEEIEEPEDTGLLEDEETASSSTEDKAKDETQEEDEMQDEMQNLYEADPFEDIESMTLEEPEFDEVPEEEIEAPKEEAKKVTEPVATEPVAVEVPSLVKKNRKKHKGPYSIPVEGILNQYPDGQYWIIDEETNRAARTLQETLNEFGIQAEVTGIRKGPVITMFEMLPAPGVKLSKIVNLQDNIALRLASSSVRIVAPIPGKHAVGIEVPNKKRNIVSFREIIEGDLNRNRENRRFGIPVILGKDITGEAVTVDLTQMPHMLIAGSTGSGKSVCVNSMILSILYQLSPVECRLILIDPKIVELKLYNDIPHLLTPVITEPKRAFQALQYCIYEMERRYACLDSMGVRDIKSYNKRIKERNIATEHMPYIVVVIDEFADLMATTGKELESTVARLAAMSRAVGIHLVLATQRPSIDVITGLIKANIPSRIAFMVASKMDSRIIIDMVGAEKLLGKGDMLYAGAVDPFPIRMQGAFISEEEVERVVEYVKTLGEPEYIDDEMFYEEEEAETSLFSDGNDPLYEKALEIVHQQGKASASYIQRRLKIGYNRAARLVEEMEHQGVVGPAQGSKPRELLRAYNA